MKYRPSNGTEGMGFIENFCENCIHGKYEHTGDLSDKPCDILSRSFLFDVDDDEYPTEWIYDEAGKPTCTEFKKWDWGRDDDGNFRNPNVPPPDDPNQLCLPFIFDELGIKATEKAGCEALQGACRADVIANIYVLTV